MPYANQDRLYLVRVYAIAPSGRVTVVQTMPGAYSKKTATSRARMLNDSITFDRMSDAIVIDVVHRVELRHRPPQFRLGDVFDASQPIDDIKDGRTYERR
jgi:hypothetical protein